MRVLFFLRRIGPYHHARFLALSAKVELTTVETRPTSMEYPWNFISEGTWQKVRLPVADDPEKGLRGQELRNYMVNLLERHAPDVIITTGWADPEYHAVVLAGRRKRTPAVVISDSRREDNRRTGYKEVVKRLILKSYSTALTAGTMSTQYLIQLGFNKDRIFRPWDVVDNNHFNIPNTETRYVDRYFICVSRFIEKKNIPTLIDAFKDYRKRGGKRKLILLGSGAGERVLRDQVDENHLKELVTFEGFVQYDRLPTLLARAFCLILPSKSDQWGLVVNEAMAAGLPVIVSKQCGCSPDLINPDVNGSIFDALIKDQLTAAMIKIDRKAEEEWNEMGTASRMIIQNWSLLAFAMGMEKACRFALNRPSFGSFAIGHYLLSH